MVDLQTAYRIACKNRGMRKCIGDMETNREYLFNLVPDDFDDDYSMLPRAAVSKDDGKYRDLVVAHNLDYVYSAKKRSLDDEI